MTDPAQTSPSVPDFDAGDIAISRELLTQPLAEPVLEIITLTDEELQAVDGLQNEPLTATPWLSENAPSAEEARAATAAAMRSMIARGIISSTVDLDPRRYEEGSQEPARYVAIPQVQGTAVLRRTSDAVLIAERTTTRGISTSYFYLFAVDEGVRVLWEVFDAAGFHLFFLLEGATLAEQLLAVVDPEGSVGEVDGEVHEIPEAEFADSSTATRLSGSRAVTSFLLVLRDAADARAFTLFASPDGLDLMEVQGEGPAATRRVGGISRSTATGIVQDIVATVVEDASSDR